MGTKAGRNSLGIWRAARLPKVLVPRTLKRIPKDLILLPTVFDRVEELGIQPCHARQLTGIKAVILAIALEDHAQFARVGDDHFVPGFVQQGRDPGGVGTRLERLLRGLQPTLLEYLSRTVECAEMAVLISKVDPYRHLVQSTLCHGQPPSWASSPLLDLGTSRYPD
jgi:hypothetical protein